MLPSQCEAGQPDEAFKSLCVNRQVSEAPAMLPAQEFNSFEKASSLKFLLARNQGFRENNSLG